MPTLPLPALQMSAEGSFRGPSVSRFARWRHPSKTLRTSVWFSRPTTPFHRHLGSCRPLVFTQERGWVTGIHPPTPSHVQTQEGCLLATKCKGVTRPHHLLPRWQTRWGDVAPSRWQTRAGDVAHHLLLPQYAGSVSFCKIEVFVQDHIPSHSLSPSLPPCRV